jgi:hypothetical protein
MMSHLSFLSPVSSPKTLTDFFVILVYQPLNKKVVGIFSLVQSNALQRLFSTAFIKYNIKAKLRLPLCLIKHCAITRHPYA